MKTILFLCTGNYYRSRFAEVFFNWHAVQQNMPWRAFSRGLAINPRNLGHMSVYTIDRLDGMKIPLEEYRRDPKDLAVPDLELADHIVAVKATEHRPLISDRFPEWLNRIEFWDIHDIDCSTPDQALPHLENELRKLMGRLTIQFSDVAFDSPSKSPISIED